VRALCGVKLKQDRFLIGILVGIALLVVTSLGLFYSRRGVQDYGPDDTPWGVIRNYVLALEKSDFQRAYGYLHETADKPDFDQFRQSFLTLRLDTNDAAVQLGEVRTSGAEVTVDLVVIHGGRGPFNDVYRETARALLEKDDAGAWKIVTLPYPYWNWDWYTPRPEVELKTPL